MARCSRRGAAYSALEIVRYGIMTVIVILIVVTFVGMFVQQKSDARLSRLAVYSQTLLYGDGGFHAPSGGALIVELARFNDDEFRRVLTYPDNRFAGARLLLTDLADATTCQKNACIAYWNKDWYDIYKPLTQKTGAGSALSRSFQQTVLIRTDAGTHPGLLSVEMVIPS